ncbi:DUF2922 domain-containing protein [Tepidibacter hydrothermalis]|uniref:DUF2922 domain-containing protein n=1 Tax=Tepidibacter hydrothermalis TaxID=3036126 RepID=A0ABY8EGE7_9FIRM|nr:DUF2922 domain-containing protein [Tepidibacter hydrothermalis]WFD10542.1 DUF2922 domain-containing protein [Tepidibacter hydrothermalis]
MEKRLDMKFVKSDGKKVTVKVHSLKDDVDDSAIDALMDYIVSKNLFKFSGESIVKKESAEIVTTQTENVHIN